MFSRKKEKPAAKPGRSRATHLSQLGLMDVPGADDMGNLPNFPGEDEASLAANRRVELWVSQR